jgi:hypothetical protein
MHEPIIIILDTNITAPEPISTVYFINPSHQSVCLYILLGNGSLNTFPRQQGIVGGGVFYVVRLVSKERGG